MLLILLTISALLANAFSREFAAPKFQVFTPDELVVKVPSYEDLRLVTVRIGVKRPSEDLEDFELGQNFKRDDDQNRIFIHDGGLKLEKGNIVNYLIVFKGPRGYEAQTGSYEFDGAYLKGSSARLRRERQADFSTSPSSIETSSNPIESRFGWGGPRHNNGWHKGPNFHHGPPPGFRPYDEPHRGFDFNANQFRRPPHNHQGNHFGHDCDDDDDDFNYHQNHNKNWNPNRGYEEISTRRAPFRTSSTSTTTAIPDIDVRFANN